ncbi:hypothetical protein RchiOBHm_Chr5g0081301 [Rosa chinensis]|uniref:Uncharacterized protein n=1 Tax=Rosa chinensis TaxID=74649 RepID=A0A2P6QN13_ROSCH|nr:hypothetical protein RchiOBHm_Chr5g0081301 [Rosa chinensis]
MTPSFFSLLPDTCFSLLPDTCLPSQNSRVFLLDTWSAAQSSLLRCTERWRKRERERERRRWYCSLASTIRILSTWREASIYSNIC